MELQLRDTEELNLTLYGLGNHSFLQPHPPGEEEDVQRAGGRRVKEDDRQGEAFYCCQPTSDPAAQSHCLLWLANHTVMTAMQRPPSTAVAPKGRCQDGGAAPRVAWLKYKLAYRASRRQTNGQKEQPIRFHSKSGLKVIQSCIRLRSHYPTLEKKKFSTIPPPQRGRLSTVSIHSVLPSRSLFFLKLNARG